MAFLSLIRKKNWGDVFLALSFILALAGLILYLNFGTTIFNPTLSMKLVVVIIVCLCFEGILLLIGSKIGKYIVFLLLLYAFIEYLGTQITYIANVMVAIDGSSFSASFLVTSGALVFSSLFALVSAIMAFDEKKMFHQENVHEKAH